MTPPSRAARVVDAQLAIGFAAWLLTIATFQIGNWRSDPAYLLTSLPISYWIALSMAIGGGISLAISRRAAQPGRGVALTLLFALVLYGTMDFAYQNARYTDSYRVVFEAMRFAEAGSTEISGDLSYLHSIPGLHLVAATVRVVASLPMLELAKFFPTWMSATIALITLAALSRYVNSAAPLLTMLAVSIPFVSGYHFSPQALGLVLFSAILAILLGFWNHAQNVATTAAAVILMAALVTIHAGLPLFLVIAAGAAAAFATYHARSDPALARRARSLSAVALIAVVMWVAYLVIIANGHFSLIVRIARVAAESFGERLLPERVGQGAFSSGTPHPNQFLQDAGRIGIAIGIGLLAAAAAYLGLRSAQPSRRLPAAFLIGVLLGCAPLLGGAIFGRLFLLLPIPLAAACAVALENRRARATFLVAIASLTIVSGALFPLTHYGNDYFEYMPEAGFTAQLYRLEEFGVGNENANSARSQILRDEYSNVLPQLFLGNEQRYFEVRFGLQDLYTSTVLGPNASVVYDSGEGMVTLPLSKGRFG